jgi:hypothetical protein
MITGRLCRVGLVLVYLGISACAAVGVVATSDPRKELGNAVALFDHGRPLPAERIIVDAIAQCEKTDNGVCIGEAYRVYGLFFQSAAVTEYRVQYQKYGFLDKTATWDTRYQASILYFRKAGAIAQDTDHYDVLSNIHYLIGKDFAYMHDMENACVEFAQSLDAHEEFQRRNPGASVAPIKGQGSFGDAIAGIQRRMGCPGQSAPVQERAEAGKSIVLNMTGSTDTTTAKDWQDFKGVWRDACMQEAAEVGAAFSMQESEPKPTGDFGTLVVVDVADYRYVSAGARKLFGVMTGNAYINAQVTFRDLRSGDVWSSRNYDTSSTARAGVFSAMTVKQVRAICHAIVAEITW